MLRETYRGTVYPWQCDHMGHMNVMWYAGKFDEATWQLHAGAVVSVRSALVEVREKVVKFVHEMRNDETGEIAAVCLLTGVHRDSNTRKSCPFPEEILRRGRELLTAYEFPER